MFMLILKGRDAVDGHGGAEVRGAGASVPRLRVRELAGTGL